MNIYMGQMINLMKEVMEEVEVAIKEGNPPFAAFLLDKKGNVIYKAHNTCNTDIDPTAHAEMKVIKKACKDLEIKDLSDYVLITNVSSCSMCFSAAIKANITNFIFGTESEPTMDPNISILDMKEKCRNEINIISGILANECRKQIKEAKYKN